MTPSTLETLTRQTHHQRRRPNELKNDEKSEEDNHYNFYGKCITESNEIQFNKENFIHFMQIFKTDNCELKLTSRLQRFNTETSQRRREQ